MFADSLNDALGELRGHALARMTSTANVRRPTGRTAQGADGLEANVWDTVHTGVPFGLGGSTSGDGGSRRITVAGNEYQQATGIGRFPHDLTDLADGDHVEVVAGEWAGSVFAVIEATKKDQATSRRVPVVEVSRPSEWA